MKLEANNIKTIYNGKVGSRYDLSMAPFFLKWKKKAIDESSMKKGDSILVFCCGTGLDFPYVQKKIENEGSITAIDFSSEMLNQAYYKVLKNKWSNIELIEADVTKEKELPNRKFDMGICTLGLSIIPEYKFAYNNLYSRIKDGGELLIGDMQLATGRMAIFNPLTIYLAKKFGGTYEGHKNSLKIYERMKDELSDIRKRKFFLGAYYYCIGKK